MNKGPGHHTQIIQHIVAMQLLHRKKIASPLEVVYSMPWISIYTIPNIIGKLQYIWIIMAMLTAFSEMHEFKWAALHGTKARLIAGKTKWQR